MEQVQMEYCEIDIWKFNEFNFSNKEVEEFRKRWSQNLVNVRRSSYCRRATRNFSGQGRFRKIRALL